MTRAILTIAMALLLATPSLGAGLMKPKDSVGPDLQIKDHDVEVVINNGFAVTTVDQVFHNPSDVNLEAVYTFPLPREASLSELSLWIDGREVVGEVVEKDKAREIYRKERSEGRETSIAEKRDYLAFDVLVSPVRAGADTRVRLVYLQPLEIDSGIGRYVYPLEEGRIDEEVHAFWDLQPQVHNRFAFRCKLRSSYPLEAVRVPGHEQLATVIQEDQETWIASMEAVEGSGALNRDIVVYYRLAQDAPARIDLLPYRVGERPGSYLLVITPGNDLREITEGVDWSVVLDVSGSMSGKIATASQAISRAMDHMRPGDRVRIAIFANRARFVTRGWVPINEVNLEDLKQDLASLEIEGGTNLYEGFKQGLRDLDADRTSAVILVSDGGANIGPTEHAAFLKLLEKRDVRVFTFVMGMGANVPLLERLAEDSGGFSMGVSNQDDLYGRILQAKTKLGREAMHGIKVELDGVAEFETSPVKLPSIYHGQQIVQFGRFRSPGEATLRLHARISGEDRTWETRITLPEYDDTYPEIERMWALSRVEDIMKKVRETGEAGELRQAVVDIGTEFSIVTDYTSMVVVREEQFEDLGIDRKNRRRVEKERKAREVRLQQSVRHTRADGHQPMYRGKPAHGLGGGAVGPWFLGLIGAASAAGALLRRFGK